jgi:GDPmannose 4,6-dehydratase
MIVGVNGQDGSYLAEHLVRRGEVVHGIGRSLQGSVQVANANIKYHSVDIVNRDLFFDVLTSSDPSVIYFTAAVHGSSGFDYVMSWEESVSVNMIAAQLCLEYVRLNPSTKFIYFGSSKVFDLSPGRMISEDSPRRSNCIYSAQKNYIYDILKVYRRDYDLNCINLWLFNHESPRRKLDYFIPKLVDIAAHAFRDKTYSSPMYTLDFLCDWGCAKEYMAIVADIGLRVDQSDFIIATGITTSGYEIADQVFSGLGLRYEDHIKLTKPNEIVDGSSVRRWFADISSVNKVLPATHFASVQSICYRILDENYRIKA